MSDQQGTTRTSASGNVWSSAPAGAGASDLYRPDSDRPTLPNPPDFEEPDETRVLPAVTDKAPAADKQPPAAARPTVVSAGPRSVARRTRKARLRLSRIDPWSVMKTSFLFSIAAGIMMWVAVYVLWTLIGASGMIEAINGVLTTLLSNDQDQSPFRVEDFVNTNKVMGFTTLFAVVNVVILTALGTIFAFLYNLSANILGGLELTLAED